MAEPQANIYIRMPYELKKKLEEISRETGESMTAIIVKAVKNYLGEKEK